MRVESVDNGLAQALGEGGSVAAGRIGDDQFTCGTASIRNRQHGESAGGPDSQQKSRARGVSRTSCVTSLFATQAQVNAPRMYPWHVVNSLLLTVLL